MSRILKQPERVHGVIRDLFFQVEPGLGYGFNCDERGHVDESKLKPEALEAYRRCMVGPVKGQVRSMPTSHIEPGELKCDCGQILEFEPLEDPICTGCGSQYDSFTGEPV